MRQPAGECEGAVAVFYSVLVLGAFRTRDKEHRYELAARVNEAANDKLRN